MSLARQSLRLQIRTTFTGDTLYRQFELVWSHWRIVHVLRVYEWEDGDTTRPFDLFQVGRGNTRDGVVWPDTEDCWRTQLGALLAHCQMLTLV